MNAKLIMQNAKLSLYLGLSVVICGSISMVSAQYDGSEQDQTGQA